MSAGRSLVIASPAAAAARARWAVRAALFAAAVLYFLAEGRSFATTENVYAIMETFALLGLVALALGLTVIAGEFDLSVAAVSVAAGILALKLGEDRLLVGVAAGLGFGLAVGLLNGLLVRLLAMPSMVVTVGSLIAVSGFGAQLTGGEAVASSNFELSASITQPVLEIFSPRSLVTLGVFAVAGLAMWKLRIGRDVVAIGSDRKAAAAAGVKAGPAQLTVFAFSGLLAGLAGSLLAYSLASATPDVTGGGTLLLQGVTAAIVGGVLLSGGHGNVAGIAFGALLLAVFSNGLGSIGASSGAISLANGALLMAIVLFDGQVTELVRLRRRWLGRTGSGGEALGAAAPERGAAP